ncbi:transcriptional regulator, ArsR family [Xylanimonas cellulosilytica DSM 15894]|uniref:Transcriptional regulator, ArsR family n=1 Tax=Xylanimonas cellulosilytica (strain DSM 15894 / JCM 12276 / CECT 5975 / KCTC 9989 / LMG 20990 / NBRC 107835 / XIL07) TaxID=446471 RepID=D1BV89_XYLCX|nr:helix-turn-helix domain-containing protein [Xylanimonas cellulosilytica]ACZ29360.1 transcriptional regulator, ArsR family [Xylanimonas cellulosilytica DSM 15894]
MEIRHVELTAESVKVLAHPLRSRLLSALRRGGPATATALAAQLRTNSGATSYHLRRLEAVGLVADTGDGRGKERLWAASTESHGWRNSAFADDEDARTAIGWLVRDYQHTYDQRFTAWLDVADTWPAAWQDVLGLEDAWVEVTPEQLQALKAEIDAVVLRYAEAGKGDPRARRIALYRTSMPLDLELDPPAAEEP